MELEKIRNLNDEELKHQEKTSAEQLFRLRFQVALGQNDGVKKLRELRKEIAQIKTIARERELGIHGELKEAKPETSGAEATPAKSEKAEKTVKAPAAHAKAAKAAKKAPAAKAKPKSAKKAAPAAKKKTAKAKGKSK